MIAHIDADAFFASAIVRKNPHLAGKPLLALGMGGGCVIAASYEAKAFGVKTGMRVIDAVKLCPDAIRMPADFHEAARASHEIEAILRTICPLVEQMSVDEWYLDMRTVPGGVPADLTSWALGIQKNISQRVGLTVSIGVGPTKLLAKMAGEYRKPAGTTILTSPPNPLSMAHGEGEQEHDFLQYQIKSSALSPSPRGAERGPGGEVRIEDFLRDRPAAAIPGIGRKRVRHTDERGWTTAWDIAQAPAEELRRFFGKSGVELKEELLGHIISNVSVEEVPPKSVSRTRSFRPTKDKSYLWAQLLKHLEYTVLKMRRDRLACRGISVWLRENAERDFNSIGANASLPQPAQSTDAILPFLRSCFERSHDPTRTYTQIGLALWHLIPSGTPQYSLFQTPEQTDRDERMQKTLDLLHERFGRNAVTRGSALSVKTGTAVTIDLSLYQ